MPDVVVVSAVVVCKLSGPFDLARAPETVPGMTVDEALGAGVLKRPDPQCTVLAFPHGEIIISGPQLPHTLVGVGEATAYLIGGGLAVESHRVENLVCDARIAHTIDLQFAADAFSVEGPSSPGPYPRIDVSFPAFGATAAIYPSGRVVITGARGEDEINDVILHLYETLGLDAE